MSAGFADTSKYDLVSSSSSPIIYSLINQHYATYKELRDDYTINEVLDIYEMMIVYNANKSIIINSEKRRDK